MSGARQHAKYSASNAHRFMACPGQVVLAAKCPEIDTEWSRKGTFAHKALEICIDAGLSCANDLIGEVIMDGRCLDKDTAKSIQHVLDYVAGLRRQYTDLRIFPERELRIQETPRFGHVNAGGIADVCCISFEADAVWVIDYKHGAGTRVDANDNKQLLMLLSACLGYSRHTGVIIQPNHFAYTCAREQNFSALDILEFLADLEEAIIAAEKPDAALVPGDHCHHCKAAAYCPALRDLANQICPAVTIEHGEIIDPAGLDPLDLNRVHLAKIVRNAGAARTWLKACEELAFREALAGRQVPGFKVVRGEARRRYRPDLTEEMLAGQMRRLAGGRLTDDELFERSLLPLTKAEKLLVEKAREAAPPDQRDAAAAEARRQFAFLTPRDEGAGLSLVPETDSRPAAQGTAHLDFSNITIV